MLPWPKDAAPCTQDKLIHECGGSSLLFANRPSTDPSKNLGTKGSFTLDFGIFSKCFFVYIIGARLMRRLRSQDNEKVQKLLIS